MKIQSVQQLLTVAMTYVIDFEDKVAQNAPKMAEAASDPELKELFSKTATKSKEYASTLEQAFQQLGEEARREHNRIADAMVHEVEQMIEHTDSGPIRDAALIVAANQQQLFRVASYGSLEGYAKAIGKQDAVKGVSQSLEESKAGDKKFTELAESKINQKAVQAGEGVAA